MRFLLLLCPLMLMSGQVTVSPEQPIVAAGKSITLTSNAPVTWKLNGGGSLSHVTSTSVTFTAPSGVVPKNQMLGCPVGPNDSIFNTRIDNLPVDPRSDGWISSSTVNNTIFETDNWGISIADNTTPTRTLHTYYSDQVVNNFVMPPAGPNLKRQGGAYVGLFGFTNRPDHHVMTVRHTDCNVYESYDDYLDGYMRACNDGTPGCNVQSASVYNAMSYALPSPDPGTNAGGLPLAPTTWHLSEIQNGHIHHATVFTSNTAAIAFGIYNWPAGATAGGCDSATCPTAMPMGTRLRLKSSFNIQSICNSGIPSQDAACNTMLTALKQYGMILCDTGLANAVQMMSEVTEDPAVEAAVQQLQGAHIPFGSFEAVDESSLEVSPSSYQVCPLGQSCMKGTNNFVAPSDQAVITATSANGQQVPVPMAIQPVAIGLGIPESTSIVAGNYSYQIPSWVNGADNQSVSWTLVSGPGSVTDSGAYTPPPATSGAGVTELAVLKGTSQADGAAKVTLRLTVLPADASGAVRIDTGAPASTTDAQGNAWTADIGIEGGGYAIPSDYPHWDPSNPAVDLAYESLQQGDDPGYTMIVPNGVYNLHLMFGMPDAGNCTVCTSWLNIGAWNQYDFAPYILEAQGQAQTKSFDWGALSNYMFQTPVDAYIPATVTNNILQVYVRSVFSDQPPYSVPLDSTKHTFLNGLEILPNGVSQPGWTINTQGQATISPGQTLNPFSVVASGGAPNDPTWTIVSGPPQASLNGSTLSLAAGAHSPGDAIVVRASDGTYSATASITEASGSPLISSSSATYNGTDAATQGQWTGVYGGDGFMIANDLTQLPAYASVSQGTSSYTWADPTSDPRALQISPGSSDLIASAYYGSQFAFHVNLTDGNEHQVALYLLDFDNASRPENIVIMDAVTSVILDTESFSNIKNGLYASWNIRGNVLIQVTETGTWHAVVSGLFFDPPSASTPSASVNYVGLDTTTQGTWSGNYGSDGYIIANDVTQLPAYARASVNGSLTYTWAEPTSDPRALQISHGSATGIASAYASQSLSLNLNLTDGATHRIALYLLDFDNRSRSESISVVDAATNAVLDTESYASFSSGDYAVWNVKGNVIFRITQTGKSHAVFSGVFFDPLPN